MIVTKGEQDDLLVKTPAYGSEGPRFDPRQYPMCSCHSGGMNSHIQTLEVKLTVYHPVFRMRRETEAPSQSPNWFRLGKLNTFL